MSSNWKKWSKHRSVTEDFSNEFGDGSDPTANFKFNSGDDFADDYDHIQQELFSVILNKYPEESMQFFDGIAHRGDEEVAALLRKLQMEKGPNMKEPENPDPGDEVVPPGSDTGFGGEGGEGE